MPIIVNIIHYISLSLSRAAQGIHKTLYAQSALTKLKENKK